MLKKISLVLSVLAALGFAVATSASAAPQQHGGKGAGASRSVHTSPVRSNVSRSNVSRSNVSRSNVSRSNVNRTNVNRTNVNRTNVNRAARGNFVVGQRYNGHIWYGRSRHFWHGQWYGYGIGPCWINVDGFWFWNEFACPL